MIDYYDSILKTMGGKKETYDFVRLFMVPGMGMCPGFGMGDNGTFDALDVVEKWRETGKAPDEIINTHKVGDDCRPHAPGVPVSAGGHLQGKRRSDTTPRISPAHSEVVIAAGRKLRAPIRHDRLIG